MKVGDLVRLKNDDEIGIIIKLVRVNDDFYYWVYRGDEEILASRWIIEKV